MRRLALLIGLLVAAAFPAAASAEPMPDDAWYLPPVAFHHPASSWPAATNFEMFDFTIYADFHDAEFPVEVAMAPDTDADGTLADANVIDRYLAVEDPRDDEIFTARTNVASQWLAMLGTYYWQAHYTADDGTVYITPIRTITIIERPPPDPPAEPEPRPRLQPLAVPPAAPAHVSTPVAKRLSRTSSRAILSRAIRTQAGRTPQKLTSSCTLPTPFLARCDLAWRDARYRYKAKGKLTSTAGGVQAKIDGTRTKRACARRCLSAIHWSVATTG